MNPITQRDIDFYRDNGYFHAKAVFDEAEVEEMREGIERTIRNAARVKLDGNAAWQGDYIPPDQLKKLVVKGFHDMLYHHGAFSWAAVHPNMRQVLKGVVGPNVQLHHSKMLVKPPEKGGAFPLHQDYPYFPHLKHSMVAASVHLDDTDEENGCICLIPGSHKEGPLKHVGMYYLDHKEYPISRGTPCPAQAGDVLFFNYLTIHGSGLNTSNRNRRNVLFQYRDASDKPAVEMSYDWGCGMMVCGENPEFRDYHQEFEMKVYR